MRLPTFPPNARAERAVRQTGLLVRVKARNNTYSDLQGEVFQSRASAKVLIRIIRRCAGRAEVAVGALQALHLAHLQCRVAAGAMRLQHEWQQADASKFDADCSPRVL